MAKIGIDFDGTCIPRLPEPGIILSVIDIGSEDVLKELVRSGHELYLWTCRTHSEKNPYNWDGDQLREETSLETAERWFYERDIPLSGVNCIPDQLEEFGPMNKPLFDVLIDDISIGSEFVICGPVEYVSLDGTGEIKICDAYCLDWNWVRQKLVDLGLL